MNREEILEAARKAVTGERRENYGNPERSFGLIARYWTAYLGLSDDLKPQDVCAMMALLKIARLANGGTLDCFVDLAGYAACGGEIFDGEY